MHGSVPFVHQQPHTPIDSVQPGSLSGLGKGWAREPSHPSTALRGRGMITTECASVTVAIRAIAAEAASKARWARPRSVTGAIIAGPPSARTDPRPAASPLTLRARPARRAASGRARASAAEAELHTRM